MQIQSERRGNWARGSSTKWALAGQNNISLVWSFRTRVLAAAVHGCPEEMRTGVDACGINVIVLGKVAHFGVCRRK